jgi:hypothetical protein
MTVLDELEAALVSVEGVAKHVGLGQAVILFDAVNRTRALLSAAREGERLRALSLRLIDWIENEVGAELPFGDNDADLIATAAALQSEQTP